MIQLAEAIEVINDRKRAMGIRLGSPGDLPASVEDGRPLLSGFDLDFEELKNVEHQIERQADRLNQEASQGELHYFSLWLDGLLVGLTAERRAIEARGRGEADA
jgi:hypothetical protein